MAINNHSTFDLQCFTARFYRALDGGHAHKAAAFFAQKGTWQRKGEMLCGPAQIAEALTRRDQSRITCHSISNFIAEKEESGSWTTQYYLTVLDNQSHDGMQIAVLMTCEDKLSLIDAELRITAKTSNKLLPSPAIKR